MVIKVGIAGIRKRFKPAVKESPTPGSRGCGTAKKLSTITIYPPLRHTLHSGGRGDQSSMEWFTGVIRDTWSSPVEVPWVSGAGGP